MMKILTALTLFTAISVLPLPLSAGEAGSGKYLAQLVLKKPRPFPKAPYELPPGTKRPPPKKKEVTPYDLTVLNGNGFPSAEQMMIRFVYSMSYANDYSGSNSPTLFINYRADYQFKVLDPKSIECRQARGGLNNEFEGYRCKYSFTLNYYKPRSVYYEPAKVMHHEEEDFFHYHNGRWRSPNLTQKFKELARRIENKSYGNDIAEHNRRVQDRISEDIAVDIWMNP